MALIVCPECGREKISDKAQACPDCGFPIADHFKAIEDEKIRKEEEEKRRKEEEEEARIQKIKAEENKKREEKESETKPLTNSFYKVYDWYDLMAINAVVLSDLQQRVHFDFPVTYVTPENVEECVTNIDSGSFAYPYIVVCNKFHYSVGVYRKNRIIDQEGNTVELYFDEKHIPGLSAPSFEVFSDNEDQINNIVSAISDAYQNKVDLSVEDFVDSSVKRPMSCHFNDKSGVEVVVEKTDRTVFVSKINMEEILWAHNIDTGVNQIDNKRRTNYRMAQMAQCFCLYYAMRQDMDREMTLYERLFEQNTGFFKKLFGPTSTPEYEQLKNMIAMGQQFSPDLVDGAFPKTSLIYHNLPNDITSRRPKSSIVAELAPRIKMYADVVEAIGQSLGVPEGYCMMNATDAKHSPVMRSKDGFAFIIASLEDKPDAEISDIVEDYKDLLKKEIAEKREIDDFFGKTTVIKDMVRGAVDNVNTRVEQQRASRSSEFVDLLGSAGCLKNTGKIGACGIQCNLWMQCSRGRGQGHT